MSMKRLVRVVIVLAMAIQGVGVFQTGAYGASDVPTIVDHRCIDMDEIPATYIERAKSELIVAYGHTSHGIRLYMEWKGWKT